ncbi:hypothetical protein DSO57_1008869 [Entomophthora muscae]|uniref:Uncharacterized protein n=1 Tax=Entomophthora muscae TaxID=34485 RepID=A0ACC2RY08_9FUNG|nr:hypothetical protein DSO57_1008869 [Entomophthora muscae]
MDPGTSRKEESKPLLPKLQHRRTCAVKKNSRTKSQSNPPLKYGSHQEFITYRQPNSIAWGEDFSTQFLDFDSSEDGLFRKKALPGDPGKVIENWVEKGQKPTLRQQMAFYVDTSRLGRFWDLLDTVLNFGLVCIYIWNTRYAVIDDHMQFLPRIYFFTEWYLALLLFLQSLPRIYISTEMLRLFVFAILHSQSSIYSSAYTRSSY